MKQKQTVPGTKTSWTTSTLLRSSKREGEKKDDGYGEYGGRSNVLCQEYDGVKLVRTVVGAKGQGGEADRRVASRVGEKG